ncbi:MAG: hypothetical protein BroJett003_05350 [Planctomycetota bacterium]|nr:MAG: hypothetical protein BroJett003_05350 [Planctomycetota bacterium]
MQWAENVPGQKVGYTHHSGRRLALGRARVPLETERTAFPSVSRDLSAQNRGDSAGTGKRRRQK